jgi:glycine/D-amino acid oxidase-like deaminating enzyme
MSVPRHRYEIRLRGRLTPTMASEFEQLELNTSTAPVDTVLEGTVDDGAALHGLLRRIEALGLELVEVRRLVDASAGGSREGATTSRVDEP